MPTRASPEPEVAALPGAALSSVAPERLARMPRRVYPLRILGMGLGGLPLAVVLHDIDAPAACWAWLVFTALGFYPVAPASNQYVIGRPFVRRAVMHLPNGKTFTITTDGLCKDHPYVGSVQLNGKPLTRDYLTYVEIANGGTLHFTMQAQPNKTWATQPQDQPYSMTAYAGSR